MRAERRQAADDLAHAADRAIHAWNRGTLRLPQLAEAMSQLVIARDSYVGWRSREDQEVEDARTVAAESLGVEPGSVRPADLDVIAARQEADE